MPPSPAFRCSPADCHTRAHSFETGDDADDDDDEDLALFNQMHSQQTDHFLLKSRDDFEDSFSTKLRYFSDYKLGISVPSRGETSDLLNVVDGEKNDYDWLLTPPESPLFTSLDDDTPAVKHDQRGRPRSQPISISRSSTMEKSHRSSRGSPSPHRLSPSSRPGSGTRGRTPSVLLASPSRGQSPTPSKTSTPGPRSASPTPRRLSTGSSSTVSSSQVRGGTSPVRISRGNSASPKIKAWQSNIPGFSSEVPPNLRTSLADRPASFIRGSSPASTNSRDLSSKFSRKSMSPTATRSVSSSHSHDRDRFSSSKGSIASSGDDDFESLQSATVGSADHSTSRRAGTYSNSRVSVTPKKPGRVATSSSAPKKSFDFAMRQMDHRKAPQNMFRPLLSSVPSTTFYTGKASSAAHRSMISRNSSITTSSNASSDQGTSVAVDNDVSDHNQDDVESGEEGKALIPVDQDEVFVFDKVDGLSEDQACKLLSRSHNLQHGDLDEGLTLSETFEALHVEVDYPEIDGLGDTLLCSTCGQSYSTELMVETGVKLCPDCSRVTETFPIMSIEHSQDHHTSSIQIDLNAASVVLVSADNSEPRVSKYDENLDEGSSCFGEQSPNGLLESCVSMSPVEEGEQEMVVGHSIGNTDVIAGASAGFSILLLNRSSSNKRPVVHGRNFTASTVSYDDLLYARGSSNSMRSSVGHGSVSASSSVDLSSVRQTESRPQRQLSGRKSGTNFKVQSSGVSLSGSSDHGYQVLDPALSEIEGNIEINEKHVACQDQLLYSENIEINDMDSSHIKTRILEEGNYECNEYCRIMDGSTSESSSHMTSIQVVDNYEVSVPYNENSVSVPYNEDSASYENGGDLSVNDRSIEDIKGSTTMPPQSSQVEEHTKSVNSSESSHGESDAFTPNLKELNGIQESSSNSADCIVEETTVMSKGHKGSKSRSITLEEATDSILFCNSIVHNLAYEAATIAVEKEEELEGSRPTVTILGNLRYERKGTHGSKQGLKGSHKAANKQKQKRVETTEMKSPEREKDRGGDVTRNVGLGNNNNKKNNNKGECENRIPPKLESKCNCTIM